MTDDDRKPDLMVLVEYTDDEGEVTGWDLWSDGYLVRDFHVDAGDTYEDAYNYAGELGYYHCPEPFEDWNDPIWRAYAEQADTDAGHMHTVDVFGRGFNPMLRDFNKKLSGGAIDEWFFDDDDEED